MNFENNLEIGKMGESVVAKWFQKNGYSVLPVYEKEVNEFKGPTLLTPNGAELICPDMIVFKKEKIFWAEVKYKSAFTWHRKTENWVTGIDLRHYNNYLKIQSNECGLKKILLFLHHSGKAKDTPEGMISPTGLFGGLLHFLRHCENHRHINGGASGMVYWSIYSLKKLASLDEIYGDLPI